MQLRGSFSHGCRVWETAFSLERTHGANQITDFSLHSEAYTAPMRLQIERGLSSPEACATSWLVTGTSALVSILEDSGGSKGGMTFESALEKLWNGALKCFGDGVPSSLSPSSLYQLDGDEFVCWWDLTGMLLQKKTVPGGSVGYLSAAPVGPRLIKGNC